MVRAYPGRASRSLTLKLHILAVGRLKAGPERMLCEDYLERARAAGRSCGIGAIDTREVDESRLGTAAERMAREASGLISALPPKASTIVLDEGGKALSSAGFAELLKNHLNHGTSDLGLMVGGPDGHGQAIRDSAGFILSLGAMTWPHRLVRAMLAEQIYRAVTILVNHPYHRP